MTDTPPAESPPALVTRARRLLAGVSPRVRLVAAAVIVVLVAATAVWIGFGGWSPASDVGVNTDKTLDQLSPDDTDDTDDPAADDAFTVPATSDEPRWTRDGDADTTVSKIGDGYLLTTDTSITRLNAKGDKTWHRKLKEDSEGLGEGLPEDREANENVVVLSGDKPHEDSWPGENVTTVLDAATGEQLWKDSTAAFTALAHDTVYLSVCHGGQDGELGECMLSAREPTTGATRWTTAVYASTEVVGVSPDGSKVEIESYVTGGNDRRVSVLDTASGRVRGAAFSGDDTSFITDDTLVRASDDDNPANGCTSTFTAWSIADGSRAWKRVVGVPKAADGSDCLGLSETPGEGDRVAVSTRHGRPEVLNLGTGAIEWTAPSRGTPVTATGDLLVTDQGGDEADKLVGYDTGSGKKRWTARIPTGDRLSVSFQSKSLLVGSGDGDACWVRVSRAKGATASYPGSCAGSGPGWLATGPGEGVGDGTSTDIALYAVT
ncbi:MAG TPA: PQQ-binding-like beta-propeller repeat protein [Stackebrandtia sp.]|jgi:hypothetical protein|uniref:outer membrane protein assembly factor BamB family protein n=1 Tax=Stackebrandtia sp. TaxID=2023065 RepID=UPI002D40A3C9|nr:PQQ-binding-like beta-propeller repeat protein [Stackebrandtia sp.]HZE41308.1 PQQ-binding-like beta-propeller repeat protein [Stackebrandtia sp.]